MQAQEEGLLLGSLARFTGRCLVRREGSPGHEAVWHRAPNRVSQTSLQSRLESQSCFFLGKLFCLVVFKT